MSIIYYGIGAICIVILWALFWSIKTKIESNKEWDEFSRQLSFVMQNAIVEEKAWQEKCQKEAREKYQKTMEIKAKSTPEQWLTYLNAEKEALEKEVEFYKGLQNKHGANQ